MSASDWSKASTADVFVAMLFGWKEWGHAAISWWLVFAPWLAGLLILLVSVVILGIANLLD